MTDRGVLYIAYGESARAQARESIRSLWRHAPGLPVAVVSDTPPDMGGVEHIYHPEADRGARTQKTQMYTLSPYVRTLYLDADTEVLADPSAGFRQLDLVDLVIGQDVCRNFVDNRWPHLDPAEVDATIQELGGVHRMYFNSGVIYFRRGARVEAMMAAWHEEWMRFGRHDQMALLRAIHRYPVRILPMREAWNTHRRGQAVFVYHKHRRARREGAPM